MKSRRMIREGSLGLLVLFGLGLFGSFVLWLRGFSFGKQYYSAVIEFKDIAKLQMGAPVRYRGVTVGSVTGLEARSNSVDVEIQITPATLRIPRQVRIEANQAGFIGETSIDIYPFQEVSIAARNTNPLDRNCKSDLIICDRDRLQGEIGVTFDELLRNSLNLSQLFGNPQFFGSLNQLIQKHHGRHHGGSKPQSGSATVNSINRTRTGQSVHHRHSVGECH
jgi:phospholipid/cholesterol/gamma-HCH transport system substrate-binding protein